MNTKTPALIGDNPDARTVFRRIVAGNVGTITCIASIVLGVLFEKEVMPFVRYEGIITARLVVYGAFALFTALAVMAQTTVVRRGRFINHLATYITVRGGQRFVDRWGRILAHRSVVNPEFVPALDIAYPAIRYIVCRAGFSLPPHYASLLKQ